MEAEGADFAEGSGAEGVDDGVVSGGEIEGPLAFDFLVAGDGQVF